ncbi:hypothetical protein SELMODRAFT_416089 [Selaginella moellendorffii]|uniref:Terpene synthase n=1 Tax=Selaginella moellendorffii TaxID=88036 RepID=D8RY18_SELML|nr:(3S,6E)-nerolidol synthase-like [Selaginella moellendorffii]EFJ23022.1 hypothetical protein SELMODRAFT_416089 [Selaginella moellendorffii]|eukprot:XP_002976117.1 (3S,6E)-nerolidol synthase-like [Selaginella moellendorffii]
MAASVNSVLPELSTLSKFELRPLPCAFPFECHPNHASLTREVDEWAIRSLQARGSMPKRQMIIESKISAAACMTIPRGRDDRKMVLAGKHLWALFLLDDALESCRSQEAARVLARRAVEVARGDQLEGMIQEERELEEAKGFARKFAIQEEQGDRYNDQSRGIPAKIPIQEDPGLIDLATRGMATKIPITEEDQGRDARWALGLFREVVAELRRSMPRPMFDRYLRYLDRYLEAVIQEVGYQIAGHIPREDEYRELRRGTSFTEGTSAIFGELCMGLELHESVTSSRDFIEFVALVADHIALTNDVLSFRKDFYAGVAHNWLVVLLRHSHRGTGFQSALDSVYGMIRDSERRILGLQSRIEAQALKSGDGHLLSFAQAFPLCLAGNRRWSSITARYHGIGNPLITGVEFHGTWLLHPDVTIVI